MGICVHFYSYVYAALHCVCRIKAGRWTEDGLKAVANEAVADEAVANEAVANGAVANLDLEVIDSIICKVYAAELKLLSKSASRLLFASAEQEDLEHFAASIVAVMRAENVPAWWDGKTGKPTAAEANNVDAHV